MLREAGVHAPKAGVYPPARDIARADAIDDEQAQANSRLWARADLARNPAYTSSNLRPPEQVLLARHHEALSGRVLELGCGAGRLTGHLARIATSLHAIDVSSAMVEACRERHPDVTVEQMDLRAISSFELGSFDAVVAPYNVLDVLGHASRRETLDDVHRLLSAHGLFVMSSHNLAAPPSKRILRLASLREAAGTVRHLPRNLRNLRNRRRMRAFEREGHGYAILNDVSHDYGALHYYTTRDTQGRQLAAHGFSFVECLDQEGHSVPSGADAAHASELHYVARQTG